MVVTYTWHILKKGQYPTLFSKKENHQQSSEGVAPMGYRGDYNLE